MSYHTIGGLLAAVIGTGAVTGIGTAISAGLGRGMRRQHSPVINLCFHGIGTPRRELEPGEEGYWVSRDQFHRVLDAVADDRRVALTFDDSNQSDLDIALPALTERGLRARFFVLAGRLGKAGSLDADGVRELAAAGMGIGSHGMEHVPWPGLDPAATHRELIEARSILEGVTGAGVDEAALPLGRYDRQLLERIRQLGYSRLHTSDRQWSGRDHWLQPRFSIHRQDTVETLRRDVLSPLPLTTRARRAGATTVKALR